MATTDFDFAITRNQLIEAAFRKAGIQAEGAALTAAQLEEGRLALNEIVKFLQTRHLYLWRLEELTVSLVAGTYTYAASGDPAVIAIDKASYDDGSNDVPLKVISRRQYFDISDKESTGDPVYVGVTSPEGSAAPTITVWPVPSQDRTLNILCICKLQDWDTAGGAGDFPSRYQLPLIYELAAYLAEDYKLPAEDRDHLRGMADRYFMDAKRSDRERGDDEFVDGAI